MGEAKRRGTREERVANAEPKPPRMGADERRRAAAQALTTALAKGVSQVLAPIFGATRESGRFH